MDSPECSPISPFPPSVSPAGSGLCALALITRASTLAVLLSLPAALLFSPSAPFSPPSVCAGSSSWTSPAPSSSRALAARATSELSRGGRPSWRAKASRSKGRGSARPTSPIAAEASSATCSEFSRPINDLIHHHKGSSSRRDSPSLGYSILRGVSLHLRRERGLPLPPPQLAGSQGRKTMERSEGRSEGKLQRGHK